MTDRKGKRRAREPRARRIVVRAHWRHRGRVAVTVEISRRGRTTVEVLLPRFRVAESARTEAARWLEDYMPHLDTEERYFVLWGSE